jgi:hypothetical protein
MTKKQLQAKYDNRSQELVNELGMIEQKMKSTTTLAGLRRLHDEVKEVQQELSIVTELAIELI